jgi:hypothetical protein
MISKDRPASERTSEKISSAMKCAVSDCSDGRNLPIIQQLNPKDLTAVRFLPIRASDPEFRQDGEMLEKHESSMLCHFVSVAVIIFNQEASHDWRIAPGFSALYLQ